jgi:hypothetical protein
LVSPAAATGGAAGGSVPNLNPEMLVDGDGGADGAAGRTVTSGVGDAEALRGNMFRRALKPALQVLQPLPAQARN